MSNDLYWYLLSSTLILKKKNANSRDIFIIDSVYQIAVYLPINHKVESDQSVTSQIEDSKIDTPLDTEITLENLIPGLSCNKKKKYAVLTKASNEKLSLFLY